jgi:copper chaperone CopZ
MLLFFSFSQSITMEMKVYMHCDACEKKVRRTISKVEGEEVIRKLLLQASAVQLAYVSVPARNDVSSSLSVGVETIKVDREENKVTVTGDFEPEKVVKKIKKAGKKAEILAPEENEDEEGNGEETYVPYGDPLLYPAYADVPDEFQSYRPERWNFHYFDDENAQACMVM